MSDEITRFVTNHPAISVELLLSDGHVGILGKGGHRPALRAAVDSSPRARALGPNRRLVCAAPDYLTTSGIAKQPVNLKDHNCLVMRFSAHLDNVWRFGPGPKTQAVTVRGARVANDGALLRQWALAGHAIILTSKLDVGPDIRAGRLAELLADFAPRSPPLHMLFPPSRARPRRPAGWPPCFKGWSGRP